MQNIANFLPTSVMDWANTFKVVNIDPIVNTITPIRGLSLIQEIMLKGSSATLLLTMALPAVNTAVSQLVNRVDPLRRGVPSFWIQDTIIKGVVGGLVALFFTAMDIEHKQVYIDSENKWRETPLIQHMMVSGVTVLSAIPIASLVNRIITLVEASPFWTQDRWSGTRKIIGSGSIALLSVGYLFLLASMLPPHAERERQESMVACVFMGLGILSLAAIAPLVNRIITLVKAAPFWTQESWTQKITIGGVALGLVGVSVMTVDWLVDPIIGMTIGIRFDIDIVKGRIFEKQPTWTQRTICQLVLAGLIWAPILWLVWDDCRRHRLKRYHESYQALNDRPRLGQAHPEALQTAQKWIQHTHQNVRRSALLLFKTLVQQEYTLSYEPAHTAACQEMVHQNVSHRSAVKWLFEALIQQKHIPSYKPALHLAQQQETNKDHLGSSVIYDLSLVASFLIFKALVLQSYSPAYAPATRFVQDKTASRISSAIDLCQHLMRVQYAPVYPQALLLAQQKTEGLRLDSRTIAFGFFRDLVLRGYTESYAPALAAAQEAQMSTEPEICTLAQRVLTLLTLQGYPSPPTSTTRSREKKQRDEETTVS